MSVDFLNEFEAGTGGPPQGEYVAEFLGVTPTDHDQWGPGAMFSFEVLEGEFAGCVSMRTSKRNPTGKNLCGRLIAGLTGQKIQSGAKINIEHLVGKKFKIMVMDSPDGDTTRLESVKRIPDEDYDG